jgi:hypothetical protein
MHLCGVLTIGDLPFSFFGTRDLSGQRLDGLLPAPDLAEPVWGGEGSLMPCMLADFGFDSLGVIVMNVQVSAGIR